MQTNSTEKKTASRSDTVDFWRDVIYHPYYVFFFCCSLYMYVCAHAVLKDRQ